MVEAVSNLLVIRAERRQTNLQTTFMQRYRGCELTSMHPDNAKVVNGYRQRHVVGAEVLLF